MKPSQSTAGPHVGVRPVRRGPKIFFAATWPIFFAVAGCVGVASVVNSFSTLSCVRAETPGGGMCHLDRGSMAFSYRESFLVDELKGAQLSGPLQDETINPKDLAGTRIYVQAGRDQHRFIDNDEWSHDERQAIIADIEGFRDDPARSNLEVRFDRRLRLVLVAFAIGVLIGGLLAVRRLKKLRMEDLE